MDEWFCLVDGYYIERFEFTTSCGVKIDLFTIYSTTLNRLKLNFLSWKIELKKKNTTHFPFCRNKNVTEKYGKAIRDLKLEFRSKF